MIISCPFLFDHDKNVIAQNTAAPETRRMDVKLAELKPVSFSAMLQRIELPRNAMMARPV